MSRKVNVDLGSRVPDVKTNVRKSFPSELTTLLVPVCDIRLESAKLEISAERGRPLKDAVFTYMLRKMTAKKALGSESVPDHYLQLP